MDKIVIAVEVEPIGSKEAIDSIEKVKKANEKLAESANKHHNESKQHHKEQIDLNTKLTHSFAELGEGILAAFALERIIEFGAECVKEFEAAEQATNDLKFAVTNLAKGTDKDFTEMIEKSEELSKSLNTLFSPKEIQKADAALLRMKLTTEQVNILMPRLLDISAKTHKTLEEVSETFGKAISEGRTGALTQFGAKFKDTGDIIGNFNKVLEKTAGFAGGAADSLEDFANKEKEAANKAELLQEELGSKLAPVWVELKTKALEAAGAVVTFFEALAHGQTKDLAVKYFNALTLNLFHLKTEEEKTAEKIKKIHELKNEELYQQEMLWAKNRAGISQEEQLMTFKLIKDEIEARKKGTESIKKEEVKGQLDLTKLTNDELEKRLEITKNDDLEKLSDTKKFYEKYEQNLDTLNINGMAKEAARVEKEIALRKKAHEDLLKLEKEYQTQLEAIKKKDADDAAKFAVEAITDEFQKKLSEEQNNFNKYIKELGEREKKLLEIQKKGSAEQRKQAKEELEQVNQDSILAKKAFDIKQAEITEAQLKKETDEAMKCEIEKNEIKWKYAEIENKRGLVNKKKTQEEYGKEEKELEIAQLEEKLAIEKSYGIEDVKLAQEIELKKLDLAQKSKDKIKEVLEQVKEVSDKIFESITTAIEENITAIDGQMERQNRMIDEQKILAEKGLRNDLAFEEKRQDELEKKKQQEEKKLKNLKELEVFLNSVATYTQQGNNPAEAVGKALGILAATKAAEAVYAEEGGILGQTSARSYVGLGSMSRMHRGGGDVLLHAQVGEGIIPKNTMENWGLTDNSKFSQFLKNPFNEKLIPSGNQIVVNDNSKVVARLESLEDTIRNKKEVTFEIDDFNQIIKTEVENGIKRVTKDLNINNRRTRI